MTSDLGDPALRVLIVDRPGFLCLRLTHTNTRMMVAKITAPTTGRMTYNHRLKSLHLGMPHTSLGLLLRKKKKEYKKVTHISSKVVEKNMIVIFWH